MIALFITIFVVLPLLIFSFIMFENVEEEIGRGFFGLALILLFINIICWVGGGNLTIKQKITYLQEKQMIEEYINNYGVSDNILTKIENHNKSVSCMNNKYARFEIEDRSEYLIDYDYYLNIYKNNFKDK